MRTPQERRNEIQQMPTEELRRRYHEGRFGELQTFVGAELKERDLAEKNLSSARSEAREETAISIANRAANAASEANRIAYESLAIAQSSSKTALEQARWARWAVIIAVIAAMIATKEEILKFISWISL